jgi:hypothetical protein
VAQRWLVARFANREKRDACLESLRAMDLRGVLVEPLRGDGIRFVAPGKVQQGVHNVIHEHDGRVFPLLEVS